MNSDINLNKITTDLQQNNNWNVMTIENVLNNNKQHPVNTEEMIQLKRSLSYKMWYHHTVLIKEGRDFAL
jgi:hypothetical protein